MIKFLQAPGKTKKIVLGGMLIVICGAMVITLVPGGMLGNALGFNNLQANVIASVDNQDIGVAEVRDTAQRMGRQQFPRGFPSQFLPFLMERAAQMLINQKVMLAEADHMGFKVTDAELQEELQHGPYGEQFFPGGTFIGQDAYESFIQNQVQMSVPQFERALKDDLLIRKLRAAVEGGVTVSDADIMAQYRKENTKIKFDYAVVTPEAIEKGLKPTEADIKAYYDQHKAQYNNSVPEKRNVQFIVVDPKAVEQKVQVTQADLQRYYNERQEQYRVPEQVNVRHILIKTPDPGPDGKVDQKAVDDAKAKAEGILKQLQGGADFAELAKKESQDTGSAPNGGSLGWIGRGRTVPEFEQAAFGLQKGQTSGVIKSQFGFHIIHVDDKQQAHLKTLDEVKPEIEAAVKADKTNQQAENLATAVEADARSKGMEAAAKNHDLKLQDSGYISRGESLPVVGSAPDLMNAVFTAQVKNPPDMVHVPEGYVIYQVADSKPPSTPTFEEIKAKVEQDYKNQQVTNLMSKKTQELSEKAHSEHDLKKAAKEVGAEMKSSDMVGPTAQVPDIGSLDSGTGAELFNLKPGEMSNALSAGRNGVVVQIVDKQEPPAAALAASRDRIRDSLLQQKREQFLSVFASDLRDRLDKQGKIRINQDELKRLTTPTNESGS